MGKPEAPDNERLRRLIDAAAELTRQIKGGLDAIQQKLDDVSFSERTGDD